MDAGKGINLVVITGMSGAGKTVAVQSLEDLGFFCIDNLPPILLPKFVELLEQSKGKLRKAALVIDLRGREFFSSLFESLDTLEKHHGIHYQILFLEASDQVLVRRYKETRRRHPLSRDGTPLDGILQERKLLEEIKGRAHHIIDTSHLKPNQLKEKLAARFGQSGRERMTVTFLSFGFKYGVPIDVDLVFDVRFLSQSPLCEIPSPAHRKGFGCVRVRDEMGTNQAIHRQVDGSFVFPPSPLSSGRKNPAGGGDRVHGGKTPFGGHRGASFPGFQRKGKLSGRASGHR